MCRILDKVVSCVLLLCVLFFGCALATDQHARPAPQAAPAAAPAPAPGPAIASQLAATIAESAKLPLDPAIRTGRLDNGLTWFVRRNVRPEKRAEIWLAVNAGSTLEDDDQQGLAHFVEHMAFRGTKNFKKLEIINFMERIGMKFGPDVNAFTNFDETVYMLKVPTDDAALVEKALAILYDWARNVSFDDEDIDKERGVVVEEWRLGRGAEARMRDKQFPILFKGSRYAERLTIGKKEILETAPHDTIRRFYSNWYRPDLMAVIVVGDIDPVNVERSIKTRFASLKNPLAPRRRVVFQSAVVQEARLARGLDTLLVELARVNKHGFNASELEPAKKEVLRYYESAYREREKEESDRLIHGISGAFLQGEPVPGIELEYGLAQRFLPTIPLDELNHLAAEWIAGQNRGILVSGPEKAAKLLPTDAQLSEIFNGVEGRTLEPWVDRVRQEPLVPNPPQPATIVEETTIPEPGVTRWKHSHGVVVLLQSTDFKNDEVVLGGFSPGGSSLVPDDRYVSASWAGQVLPEGGLGQFDKIELGKALTGKIARAYGYVGELEESVRGGASPRDRETK